VLIDLGVVALLLIFTLLGVYQGLVPQLFRIGALLLIWFFLTPLGTVFSVVLLPFGLPWLTRLYLGALIGAIVVYGGLGLLGRYLSDRFINTRTSRMEAHSKLGGYAGFIKGTLVVVLVLFVLGALPEGYLEKKPKLEAQLKSSWSVSLANLVNPLPELTVFDDLSAYQKLLKDPAAVARLKEQPAFQKLRQHPAVQELLADAEISRKFEEGDYRSLLAEPKVVEVLKDREVRTLLAKLNPRQALAAPAEPLREPEPEDLGPEVLEPETMAPGPGEPPVLAPDEEPENGPSQGNLPVIPDEP